jgi:hypothetical protein
MQIFLIHYLVPFDHCYAKLTKGSRHRSMVMMMLIMQYATDDYLHTLDDCPYLRAV